MKRKIAAGITAVALAVGGLMWATPAMAEEVADAPPVAVVEAPAVEAVTTEVPATAPEEAPPTVQEAVVEEGPAPFTQDKEQVCDNLDTGHLSADGAKTYLVTAPEGKVIVKVCVKAGSVEQGNGPEYTDYNPGVASVTISHSSGKDISHYSVQYADAPVEVQPLACVGIGAWYTESDDLAPVATPEGLVFQDDTAKAVGIRVPVTGNLQGWEPVSFVNTGGQEQFFFRIVIDASADDGPAYKSLSFPGYTTIDKDSVSYQYGESIAATAERFPNAVIKSVGFQTNSLAPADYVAVLKSVAGPCATANYVHVQPASLSGVETEDRSVCVEPLDGTAVVTTYERKWVQDYAWIDGAWVLGEKVFGDWTPKKGLPSTVEDPECEPLTEEPEVVTLGIPQFTDVCGTADDEGSLPEDTEGVHYNWASDDTESPDYWTVRAWIDEGYVVEDVPEGWVYLGEGVYEYASTLTDEACPTPTPTPTTPAPVKPATPASLAATGGGDMAPIVPLAAGIMTMLGLALVVARRFARR